MKKKVKKELLEWTLFIALLGGLYLTGLHTEVIGTVQRLVLSTGILQPDIESQKSKKTSYNLTLKSAKTGLVDVSEFKGKVIFLNFWATWCPPCIAEMPDINDLYGKTADSVVFLMVSLDEQPEKALNFIERKQFDFPVFFPASKIPVELSSQSIPTTFVIDRSGNIVVENRGMAKYDTKKFRELLLSL